MSIIQSRFDLIERVVTLTHGRTKVISEIMTNLDRQSSKMDTGQLTSSTDSLKASSDKSFKFLEALTGGTGDEETISFIETQFIDPDGLFMKIDEFVATVGELEYEITREPLDYQHLVSIFATLSGGLELAADYLAVSPLDAVHQRYVAARSRLKKILFYRYREVGIFTEIKSTSSSYAEEDLQEKFNKKNKSEQIAAAASDNALLVEELKGANKVIDAMGKEIVSELMETLIDFQLMPYHARGRFSDGDLHSLKKESLDKRWDELYRMLTACSAVQIRSMISPEWNLPFACYTAFCTLTAQHLRALLDSEVDNLKMQSLSNNHSQQLSGEINSMKAEVAMSLKQVYVVMIIQVMENVLGIENEVHKMFDKGVYAIYGASTEYNQAVSRRISMSMNRKSTAKVPYGEEKEEKKIYRCHIMSSMIADDYMDPYIQTERRIVEDKLEALVSEDRAQCGVDAPVLDPFQVEKKPEKKTKKKKEVTPPVPEFNLAEYNDKCITIYNSANILFQMTRNSLIKCAALSNEKPLLSLLCEYKVVFQIYAEMLRSTLCPSPPSSGMTVMSRRQRVPYALTLEQEIMTCRAIATADHCIGVLPQLEAEMHFKIHDKYKSDVHFPCELYEDVISHAIDLLVSSLMGKINDSSLVHMANTNWSKYTVVGDVSPYVHFLARNLRELVPRLRKVLPDDYFETLCIRFASDFLDNFLALVMGLKGVGVAGAQQILLDVKELKPILDSLHSLGRVAKNGRKESRDFSPIKSAEYDAIVDRKVNLLSTVLRLILTDDKQIDETFNVLWPEGKPADLKAIKKLKSSSNAISSKKDTAENQYVDRRTFHLDESTYQTKEKVGMMSKLTAALAPKKKN